MDNSVRKEVGYTIEHFTTDRGRHITVCTEKILMPNGRYRYPVTYSEDNFRFVLSKQRLSNRRGKMPIYNPSYA